eukprot:scaffold19663_cov46-Prasinocladus_malaysianus.AAC.1
MPPAWSYQLRKSTSTVRHPGFVPASYLHCPPLSPSYSYEYSYLNQSTGSLHSARVLPYTHRPVFLEQRSRHSAIHSLVLCCQLATSDYYQQHSTCTCSSQTC